MKDEEYKNMITELVIEKEKIEIEKEKIEIEKEKIDLEYAKIWSKKSEQKLDLQIEYSRRKLETLGANSEAYVATQQITREFLERSKVSSLFQP